MWGFTGILGKLIHLEPLHIVWSRMIIATVALAIGMVLLKRSFKPASFSELLQFSGVGAIVALHWVTFYISIDLSTASLGILCLSTTTIHVAWLEPLLMKRAFSWTELLMASLVIFGIYFVSDDFNAQEYEALAYGLSSAFFAALFSVFNSKFSQTSAPSTISLYEFISGVIFLTCVLAYRGELTASLFEMTLSDFLWLLFLGILCTTFAFLAIIEILKRLGTFTVSLSINLEPVYTILLAIVILNENQLLGYKFYLGSVLIVAIVLANAAIKRRQRKRNIL